MATLTNTKIKDTYDGLLKTTDNDVIDATGVTLIEDGLGNASAISIGRANNGVTITGALTASGLSYPTSDGTAGQAIVTDAAGNLSFATVTTDTPTLQEVTTEGATTTDSITVGGLTAASLIYPSTDGTSGQVISTDGAGNLTFTTVSTSTPTLDQVTAVGATSSVNVTINGADLGTITSSSNTLFGDGALASHTSGSSNTAIGQNALTAYTGGSYNTAFGAGTLDVITSGGTNTAVGYNALGSGTTLSYNTAIGDDALFYINGSYNVALGHNAGETRTGGGTKSAGDSNIYIGSNTVSAAADTDNEIVIGANATGNGSNSATYGDSNITEHIFTAGNVGIGTSSPAYQLEVSHTGTDVNALVINDKATPSNTTGFYMGSTTEGRISVGSGADLTFYNGGSSGTERMKIQSNGQINLGDVAQAVPSSLSSTVRFIPAADTTVDLGFSTRRWEEVWAVNGTINTSDANEKQQIEDLDEAELRVATRIKGLVKKFKWNTAVEKKGENARIHIGVIAQDVKAAFEAEGLDADRYSLFTSNTWWEKEIVEVDEQGVETTKIEIYEEFEEGATERTRLGVRYTELLAFVIAAL